MCYSIFIFCALTVGILMKFKSLFYVFSIIPILHLMMYQIKKLKFQDPNNCLRIFKSNNFFGFIIFINILIGKLN